MGNALRGSVTTHSLSLRGGSGSGATRQSIVSRRDADGLSLRLLVHSGSPRAFSPRDDKSEGEWRMPWAVRLTSRSLSLRGGSGSERRGNPSCLEERGSGLSLRLLVHSGSPRAFSPRDDKVGRNGVCGSVTSHSLSLRGGSEASDAAIHRVSRDADGLSLRLLVHSGSPRAFSPRDDKE